jgi:hypothetical protein
MDFIERWFHFSPDGGNELTELAYIAVPILVAAAVAWVRRARRAHTT